MNSERIKEIQAETAYPQSRSVHQALLKVWNECEQKQDKRFSEEEVYDILIHHTVELFKKEPITLEDFWNKFKKK